MAKNRFNTRASYDTDFKYGISEIKGEGKKRTITEKQVKFMKNLYELHNLTDWERNFIKSLLTFDTLSEKQLETLKSIFIKRTKK